MILLLNVFCLLFLFRLIYEKIFLNYNIYVLFLYFFLYNDKFVFINFFMYIDKFYDYVFYLNIYFNF